MVKHAMIIGAQPLSNMLGIEGGMEVVCRLSIGLTVVWYDRTQYCARFLQFCQDGTFHPLLYLSVTVVLLRLALFQARLL